MSARLLPASSIPPELWTVAAKLRLSAILSQSYRLTLDSEGLLKKALEAKAGGDIGGESAQDTNRHFTHNFSGSCGRVQLALLDPHNELENASDLFIRAFSGGKVGLLDIPCGTGAASAATLSTIAELRERGVIPRIPLDIYLVAGDKSAKAREIATQLLGSMNDALRRQGISIHVKIEEWDVLEAQNTRELLHTWMEHARDCREYFVLAANFSGVLKHGGNFDSAKPQLDEVFGWAAARKSSVVWIEPRTGGATNAFWPQFKKKLWRMLPSFFKIFPSDVAPDPLESDAQLEHPIRPNFCHRVNLSLIKLARNAP